MSTKYYERFTSNIDRVYGLITLYEKLNSQKEGSKSGAQRLTDILRSSVVLLHAAEEDYLRCILTRWYPYKASGDSLKKIPIANSEGRAEKFQLDRLMGFKTLTVEQLICLSVEQAFEKTSFNSYAEIKARLSSIGVSLDLFDREDLVDSAIKRRHAIVHEADLCVRKNSDGDDLRTSAIRASSVRSWVESVRAMIEIVDEQIELWDQN